MKTNVSLFTEFRKYYLSEFELYDGEAFITFHLVGVNLAKNETKVAVTDGVMFERVYLDEFEEAAS